MLDGIEALAEPTALRLQLLANGWIPLPVAGKRPMLKAWQNISAETLTPNAIRQWQHAASDQPSTGLVCGRLAAVDIDVPVVALAERLRAMATALLGPTRFLRIGRAPKLALCYRVEKPDRKLLTPALYMPDGTKVQIEVLSVGQQIVGYGIHPDTALPYTWPEAAPHGSAFAEVPETTTAELASYLSAAEAFLRASGAREKAKPEGNADMADGGQRRDPKNYRRRPFGLSGFAPPTMEDVLDALSAIPNDCDWHNWHKIGAAIYDVLGDDGESMFDAWSRQSERYNAQATKQKWASYRTSRSTVKAASLFWAARRNGWRSPAERQREGETKVDNDRHAAPDNDPEAKAADGLSEARKIFDAALPKGRLIRLRGGALHDEASHGEAALIEARVPIFQRGKNLVRPAVQEVPASRGRTARSACLVDVGTPALIDNLCRIAHWEKFDGRAKSWVEVNPPKAVADTILSREGEWRFQRIAGVMTTPTLRPDGTLLVDPGYDAVTRIYHHEDPDLKLHPSVFKPTRQYAELALQVLVDLLDEFPFVDDASRAVALSGIITPVVRGSLSVAPLHVFKAHTAGTGKSYLTDIVSAISTGQPCPVVSAAPDDEKETDKRIAGLLLAGYPICSLDNVNGDLGGDLLCQAIERPLVRVRALGGSDIFEIESKATWFATGNNLRIRGDMVRRTVISILDAAVERPELREFKRDPVGEILRNRGRYVSACLAIVRAYVEAGRPNQLKPIASFEDWSSLVRSAIVWLGFADPAASMEVARADDPEMGELNEFLVVWNGALGTEPYAVSEVVKMVGLKEESQMGEPTDYQHPELRELLHRMFGERVGLNSKRMGTWLGKSEGKIVGSLRIKRAAGDGHKKVQRWRVEAVQR